jgi:hypothetical protein
MGFIVYFASYGSTQLGDKRSRDQQRMVGRHGELIYTAKVLGGRPSGLMFIRYTMNVCGI